MRIFLSLLQCESINSFSEHIHIYFSNVCSLSARMRTQVGLRTCSGMHPALYSINAHVFFESSLRNLVLKTGLFLTWTRAEYGVRRRPGKTRDPKWFDSVKLSIPGSVTSPSPLTFTIIRSLLFDIFTLPKMLRYLWPSVKLWLTYVGIIILRLPAVLKRIC